MLNTLKHILPLLSILALVVVALYVVAYHLIGGLPSVAELFPSIAL